MRDYDPAIARWTGVDPVIHYSQSPYNAFDGNPVFWADPSGADGITPEPINTWHKSGTSYSTGGGTGQLANTDHVFGESEDEFWTNETAYTGGELSWSKYFEDVNESRVSVGNLIDNGVIDDQQKSTDEEKLQALLSRIKVNEKIDINEFGNAIPSSAKKFISSLERTSKSEFKLNRTFLGRGLINEKARITIEINGKITEGKLVKTGLKITSHGLPKSKITYPNGETHSFNTFIISGDKLIYANNGKFYNTSTSGF